MWRSVFVLATAAAVSAVRAEFIASEYELKSSVSGGTLSLVMLENSATGEFVSFAPGHGAGVEALVLANPHTHKLHSILRGYWPAKYQTMPVSSLRDLLTGNGDVNDTDSVVDSFLSNSFNQNKQLIPWPNRLADHTYKYPYNSPNSETFSCPANELPNRNSSLHGLLYNQPFDMSSVSVKSDSVSVTVGYLFGANDATQVEKACYPFYVATEVTFTLSQNKFSVQVMAQNLETERMAPFGAGVHFYFSVPSIPNATVVLDRSHGEQWNLVQVDPVTLIPTEKYSRFDGFDGSAPIGDVSYDTGFSGINLTKLGAKTRLITGDTVSRKNAKRQVVVLETSQEFPFMQVFTGLEGAVALEPMSVPANAFNNGRATFLEPHETWTGSYSIYFE
eukprot:TRINITY_DN5612_c0_g1_i1.p1 TRINITY_DN5612_c0_g1~~TRINITY_DN5612_c0_g1_i1.p1  ORF type:complete len:391 (-),score=71.36 TRINITY_DN5612_c0_g1_i1:35-1207(-)